MNNKSQPSLDVCESNVGLEYRVRISHQQDQKPLTLALSRRERGLTVVDARDTPT
jgi:hypothetical protein